MIQALLLIFEPVAAWDRHAQVDRSVAYVLGVYLLPLLVLTSAGEGYGLVHWGKEAAFSHVITYSVKRAISYEIAQLILTLLVVAICAKTVKSLAQTFHGAQPYRRAFAVVAYTLGPLFLLRFLDTYAKISPWVAWSIGIVLSVAILYQGLPRMLLPDPSHAFGLYVMTATVLILATGLMRFLTAAILQGQFGNLQNLLPG